VFDIGKFVVIYMCVVDDDMCVCLFGYDGFVIFYCFFLLLLFEVVFEWGWWVLFVGNFIYKNVYDFCVVVCCVLVECLFVEIDSLYLVL